jgi:hypothetical protein
MIVMHNMHDLQCLNALRNTGVLQSPYKPALIEVWRGMKPNCGFTRLHLAHVDPRSRETCFAPLVVHGHTQLLGTQCGCRIGQGHAYGRRTRDIGARMVAGYANGQVTCMAAEGHGRPPRVARGPVGVDGQGRVNGRQGHKGREALTSGIAQTATEGARARARAAVGARMDGRMGHEGAGH